MPKKFSDVKILCFCLSLLSKQGYVFTMETHFMFVILLVFTQLCRAWCSGSDFLRSADKALVGNVSGF